MNEYEYNEFLRQEYEKTHSIAVLERYIVSETVSPIGDYEHARQLIREHYLEQTNSTLLIIGAHLVQYWSDDHNEFLDILTAMYDYLPEKEQAIISYLKAEEMRRDFSFDYMHSPQYKQHLLESVAKTGIPFVNNRVKLAELCQAQQAIELLRSAISYIDVDYANKTDIPDEYFCEPSTFINEFICGTQVPKDRLVELQYRLQELESVSS